MTKVTIIGAGKYGSTTAQRIAAADITDEVVMTDIVEGLPQGLALDMNQSRPLERYRTLVTGTNDYADTADSDVVVITAGARTYEEESSYIDLLYSHILKATETVGVDPESVG